MKVLFKPGSGFIVFVLASVALPANSQSARAAGATAILLAMREAANVGPRDERVTKFATLIYPALALSDVGSSDAELARFDRVPNDNRISFSTRSENIFDQAKLLAKGIEITNPLLTKEQKEAVEAARKLLFTGSGSVKSETYRRYLDYEKTHFALHAELVKASNPAERTNILMKITTNDQDWAAYGKKLEVSQAIATVSKYSSDQVSDLHANWKTLLESPASGSPFDKLWENLASSSDWSSVTTTLPAQSPVLLSWQSGAGGKTDTRALTGAIQLSFKWRYFHIPRPVFDHPFLRASNWRNKNSFVLSDGNQKTNPAELVPRLVASVMLVKGLELSFASMDAWRAVSDVLSKNGTVTFGGLPLRGAKVAGAFTSPRYISTPQPLVVAAIIHEMPQIPTTDPNAAWWDWKN